MRRIFPPPDVPTPAPSPGPFSDTDPLPLSVVTPFALSNVVCAVSHSDGKIYAFTSTGEVIRVSTNPFEIYVLYQS